MQQPLLLVYPSSSKPTSPGQPSVESRKRILSEQVSSQIHDLLPEPHCSLRLVALIPAWQTLDL
jgi:hypothetical protein